MARSFNEKMEKKRQAEYNPVWHRRMRSVWNMATTASGGVTHYAKFPNELAERCILCGTAEGDVVLDPFIGSGTSCRVANRYGRQYIGD
jgi:DNA modification methylase